MGLGDSTRERQRRKALLATLSRAELVEVHRQETNKLARQLIAQGYAFERQDHTVWLTKRGEEFLSRKAPSVLASILQREGRL